MSRIKNARIKKLFENLDAGKTNYDKENQMSSIKNARIKKLFENLDAGKTNYDKENQDPCQEVRQTESFTTNQNEDWLENNEEENWEASDTTVQSLQTMQGNIVQIPSTEFFNIPAPNKACLQVNIEEEIRSSQNYPAVLTPLKNVQLHQYENQCFPDTRSDISHGCATYKDVSETAFQFDIDIPSTSAPIPRNISRKNYEITPIHSDESDVDLSDNDPTYTLCGNSSQIMQPKSSRRSSSSDSNSSSSSSTSSLSSSNSSSSSDSVKSDMHEDQEINDAMVSSFPASTATSNVEESGENGMEQHIRSRKRSRHPSQWKQNSATLKRNWGQAYVSSNKEILAREVKPPCSSKCRLKCNDKIVAEQRLQLFETFWGLGNINLQRSFIASCLVQVVPKYKYSNVEKPRNSNQAFYFNIENKKTRVCKIFFINTLDITDRVIRTVKDKTDSSGFVQKDFRGKHEQHKKIDEEIIQDMIDHINTIPRIEAHYVRSSTSKEYIEGSRTLASIYRDFEKNQKERNRPAGKYHKFNEVFNTKFNIAFHKPKKDQCDLCSQYFNSNQEEKERLKIKYETHIKEKELCRKDKLRDRQNIDENNLCLVYDMQAQMPSPNGETSAFYYKSKLNSENFTVVELSKKTENKRKTDKAYENVHCYFWDETNGKKGSTEIGSSVLHYLTGINDKSAANSVNIVFYSDNCAAQNKNKYVASVYLYALTKLQNIQSITHKFLIQGHTQNEGDNVHSVIEKEIKRNLKSGQIYVPHQYIALIKSAKKTGNPFKVHELSFDFFKDLKNLQEQWGYNFNENTNRQTVSWHEIKVLQFRKLEPWIIKYKTSYEQDDFETINIRNKRKRNMPNVESIAIKGAYSGKLKLPDNKKRGLRELMSRNLIPNFYADFYKDIITDD